MSRKTSRAGYKPRNKRIKKKLVSHRAKKNEGRPVVRSTRPFMPSEYVGKSLADLVRMDVVGVGKEMPVDGPIVKRPVQQALENWMSVQLNAPWWWLCFSYGKKCAGVAIVQGVQFLDAVNRANQLKISPVKAGVFGEELNDLWVPKDGSKRERWIDRLLTPKEANGLFPGVHKVSEVELYKAKDEEVKFK